MQMIKTIFGFFLVILTILMVGQAWASVSVSQGNRYQYDVSSVALGAQIYGCGAAAKLWSNEVGSPTESACRENKGGSFFASIDGFVVAKGQARK
jgi:hypothetical protein